MFGRICIVLLLGACVGAPQPSASANEDGAGRTPSERVAPATYDAALTRLFTPRAAPAGAYQVLVSPQPIAVLAERYRSDQAGGLPDGSFRVARTAPLEAFGAAGPYDRSRLARLYGGRRVEVARGPVIREGRTVASVTLLSPYPDVALDTLRPGTMVVLTTIRPGGPGPT